MSDAALGVDETQPRPHRERRARLADGVNWANADHDVQMQIIGLRLKPIEDDVGEIKLGLTYVHQRIDKLLEVLGTNGVRTAEDGRGMSTQTMVYRTAELISRKPWMAASLALLIASTVGGGVFGLLAWQALQ